MPSLTRRQSPAPERRRDDLLDAAVRVFRSVGVDGATVAAIAAEAGTAKGNFYRYFASKEELLAALKARFLDDLVAEVGEFAAQVGTVDWWGLVDRFLAAMIDWLLARRDVVWIMTMEPSTAEAISAFEDSDARIVATLAGGIHAGVAAGVFDVEDPETTAWLLQHAVFGTVQHLISQDEPVDRDRLVAATGAMVRRTLGGTG